MATMKTMAAMMKARRASSPYRSLLLCCVFLVLRTYDQQQQRRGRYGLVARVSINAPRSARHSVLLVMWFRLGV